MSNFKHSFFRTLLYAQLLSGFSGVAIAAQISLSVKDRPMREVIKELEETTEYRFFYNDGIKGLNSPISVDVEDADINAVMDAIAKQANVAYVLKSGHQIVLSSVKTVQQQGNKKVTGTITDPKGEPIIGANVVVKGSTNGTITDIDGHFSIEVTPNAILQVSYIGYVAQDVPVGNKDNLVISIHEDTQKLDEVVVVGYGSQKKVNLTGAVEQVTSDVFEGRPTANATQMLEGVVPNLNISLSDGKPGRTADFNVRGAGSINGGSALVLIDGVEGDPSMLNPNDIESISVLKDASATAVYGVKGANGVILITTKRGTEGKAKISASASTAIKLVSKLPETYGSADALYYVNKAIKHELGLSPSSWGDIRSTDFIDKYNAPAGSIDPETGFLMSERYPDVDWQKELFKDYAMSYNANVNIAGGTKAVKYYAAIDYQHEGDLFREWNNNRGYTSGYGFNRINVRSNLDFQLTKTTTLKANLSGSHGIRKSPYGL